MKTKTTTHLLMAAAGLILFILINSTRLQAQCWQWASRTGGTSLENPTAMSVDLNGQMAVCGEFTGTAIIGSSTLTDTVGRDVFTAIIDSSGTVIKGMAGVGGNGSQNFANGVASDINGNIYVTGNFEDTIIFDNVTLISEGNSDIFIVKYDASGNLLWAKRAGGPNFVYANDIAVDTSGNCYVVGSFYDSVSFGNNIIVYASYAKDVFTVKYDSNGNALWAGSCGHNSEDIGSGVAVDAAENVYITGKFQSDFVFDNSLFNTSGLRDFFVAKYDATGNPQWAKTGGGTNNDYMVKIAVNGDNIYAVGHFESDTIWVDSVSLANASPDHFNADRDVILLNLDANGLVRWGISAGSYDNDYANDVSVDDQGNAFITGTFNDTISFGSTTLIKSAGDFFLAKYDNSGSAIWAKTSDFNDALGQSNSVAVFNEKPVISGSFVSGMAPPLMVFGSDTVISNGSVDVFIAKIGPPCNTTGLNTAINNNLSITAFPNPFDNQISIHLTASLLEDGQLELFNAQGSLIATRAIGHDTDIMLETSNLAAGIYLLKLTSRSGIQQCKLLKLNK